MLLRRTWVLGLSLIIGACEGASTDPESLNRTAKLPANGTDSSGAQQPHSTEPVASVSVTLAALPGGRAVQGGDSLGFSAVVKDFGGTVVEGRSVTWSASDGNVIRIDGSFGNYAIARALGAGATSVTATSEGKTGSVVVTVN